MSNGSNGDNNYDHHLDEEEDVKNVMLNGKDAETLLKQQLVENNNKKYTRKNANANANKNNLKNDTLTQKNNVSENENDSNSNNVTTNTNLDSHTTNTNTGKNKEIMVGLNKLTMNLLNHQVVMKLFHFQADAYGAHKASDAYLDKFAHTMDKFLEIAQGIYGKITLKKYTLSGSSHTDDNIIRHLEGMIVLLREKIDDVLGNYTDLINLRDELVGDVEQFKYLLTFK